MPLQMVAKPPFVVEINKGGETTLALQCSFPSPGEGINTNPEDQQQYGKFTFGKSFYVLDLRRKCRNHWMKGAPKLFVFASHLQKI